MDRLNPKIIIGIVFLDVVLAAMGTVYLLFGPTEHRSEILSTTILTWVLGAGAYLLYRYLRTRGAGPGST